MLKISKILSHLVSGGISGLKIAAGTGCMADCVSELGSASCRSSSKCLGGWGQERGNNLASDILLNRGICLYSLENTMLGQQQGVSLYSSCRMRTVLGANQLRSLHHVKQRKTSAEAVCCSSNRRNDLDYAL